VNSRRIYSITITIFCLGLLAAFSYYLYTNTDKYLRLFRLSTPAVCLVFILSLVLSILNGIINTYLFRSLGLKISYRDGFLVGAVTSLANQLPISGGIIFKGIYLKRKFNLSYAKYLSATLALFVCFMAGNGLIGVTILACWHFVNKIAVSPFLVAGFSAMVATISIFWLPLDRIKLPARFQDRLHVALGGWTMMSKTPFLTLELIGLQSSFMLVLATQYWIVFHMLSQSVSIAQTILFSSGSILNLLVSFMPGGLGVTEAIVGTIASLLGFDIGVSVVALGLLRLVSTLTIVVIGSVSTVIIGKQMPELSMKKAKERNQ
jgi:uncharacterized membrane protein YbhN (UPF0104 family)